MIFYSQSHDPELGGVTLSSRHHIPMPLLVSHHWRVSTSAAVVDPNEGDDMALVPANEVCLSEPPPP